MQWGGSVALWRASRCYPERYFARRVRLNSHRYGADPRERPILLGTGRAHDAIASAAVRNPFADPCAPNMRGASDVSTDYASTSPISGAQARRNASEINAAALCV